MQTLWVKPGSRAYNLHIGAGLLGEVGALTAPLRLGKRLGLITHPSLVGPYA